MQNDSSFSANEIMRSTTFNFVKSLRGIAVVAALAVLLAACAANDDGRLNFNLMTDEEIIAYNQTQRIWDQVHCTRESDTKSRIKKRYCATLSQLNRRASQTGEQMNIISFGTPQIFR